MTVGAAAGYGGQISFGYNGGQWNFGGNVGLGEGAWGSYSGIDSGSHESGTFGSDDASATDGSWSISTQIDTSGNGSMCVDYNNNPENGLGGEVSVDEGTGNVSVGPSWSFGDGTFIGPGLVTYGPDGKPADNAGNPGDSDTGDGSGGSDGGYYPSGGEGKCCCDCCISLIPQSGGSSPSSASSSHSHGRTRRMRPRDLQHIMRTQERVHIRMDE